MQVSRCSSYRDKALQVLHTFPARTNRVMRLEGLGAIDRGTNEMSTCRSAIAMPLHRYA